LNGYTLILPAFFIAYFSKNTSQELKFIMPISNLPAIWSETFLDAFETSLVYGSIANRDFEGNVAYGATVNIPDLSGVTIDVVDYDPDLGLASPEYVNHTVKTLAINQYKAFNFYVDSIQKAQESIDKVAALSGKAARAMAMAQDTFIANTFPQAASAIGTDAAPIVLTADNIYANLVTLSVNLDERDVPQDDRSVVLPPAAIALLRQADLFTRRDDVVVNGTVGAAAGFEIKMSNRVPVSAGGAYRIIASHPSGISFVSQLDEMVQYTPENKFGTGIKGLSIYGAQMLRPESVSVLTATI
jgi:hypothetical protein